jgi:hypothetical protein
MTVRSLSRKSLLPVVVAIVIAATAAYAWMKMQHRHTSELDTAERFVNALRDKDYGQAFELTTKARVWGYDGEDFRTFAPRQICGGFVLTDVFPIQTNGNRLRRRLSGQEPDMPEVNVQYGGKCFFRVTLRREAGGAWRVVKFGSHAG